MTKEDSVVIFDSSLDQQSPEFSSDRIGKREIKIFMARVKYQDIISVESLEVHVDLEVLFYVVSNEDYHTTITLLLLATYCDWKIFSKNIPIRKYDYKIDFKLNLEMSGANR